MMSEDYFAWSIRKKQESAVKKAWTVPYLENTHHLLLQTIRDMNESRGSKPYANNLAIVQSSGTGKSRTAQELGKLVFTIPLNVRAETHGFPYPFSDEQIYRCLITDLRSIVFDASYKCHDNSKPISELTLAHLHYIKFLYNLFAAVLDEVNNLPHASNIQEVAESWAVYLEGDTRKKLYNKVETMSMSYNTPIWGSIYEGSSNADNEVECIVKKTLKVIQALISRIDELANGCGIASNDIRVVIYFDEAHEMANKFVTDLSGRKVSFYDALCTVTKDLLAAPVFFLYLSTDHVISTILPSPFNELSFDLLHNGMPIINSGTKTLEEVSRIDFMCSFGRPLFKSLALAGSTMLNVISLARCKLIGRTMPEESFFSDDLAVLAVLAVRLLPDIATSRPHSRKALIELLRRHMAIAYSIPQHLEMIQIGYPSEPIIAEAAALQMSVMRDEARLGQGVAVALCSLVRRRLIDKDEQGELVTKLILTLAYDEAVDAFGKENGRFRLPESGYHALYSRGVPLKHYIRALLGEEHAEKVLNSYPDNVEEGKPFKEAYSDAWVRFTHFQRAGDSSVISSEACWAAAARAMAFQCSPDQEFIDILIPIVLGKDSLLCEATMSAILVQIDTQRNVATGNCVEFDERDLNFFPRPSDERPYIRLVMELGVQLSTVTTSSYRAANAAVVNKTSSNILTSEAPGISQSQEKTDTVTHPRYTIIVRGCSPSVYGVVDSQGVFTELLKPRLKSEEDD